MQSECKYLTAYLASFWYGKQENKPCRRFFIEKKNHISTSEFPFPCSAQAQLHHSETIRVVTISGIVTTHVF